MSEQEAIELCKKLDKERHQIIESFRIDPEHTKGIRQEHGVEYQRQRSVRGFDTLGKLLYLYTNYVFSSFKISTRTKGLKIKDIQTLLLCGRTTAIRYNKALRYLILTQRQFMMEKELQEIKKKMKEQEN